MAASTGPDPDRRAGRRIRTVAGSLSPGILAVAVVLFGAGFTSAGYGASVIGGKASSGTAAASLSDSKGTPLSLSGPAGRASLAVSRRAAVESISARFTGGLARRVFSFKGERLS